MPEDRELLRRVFRRGSATFYAASRLFPRDIRDDVEALYAFVRIADDCVDELPADPERLAALEGTAAGGPAPARHEDGVIVAAFSELAARREFDPAWTGAFFDAMRADLAPVSCQTLAETERYMHGSAEVIGLMMARVMGAPLDALPAAALLGRAYQYVNMLRDIGADQALGRSYVPTDIIASHGLPGLAESAARAHPDAFGQLMRAELDRYRAWQDAGMGDARLLPRSCRIAVEVASRGYLRTAAALEADPFLAYGATYRPGHARLALYAAFAVLRA